MSRTRLRGAPPREATRTCRSSDTGAAQFLDAHPTWDGRGVTIGIVDTGVSLDHPSLTTTSTGERKIVDWVTGTDPLTDGDPTWINMATQVCGASFTFSGATYTAPAAGSYRIGAFRESDRDLRWRVRSRGRRRWRPEPRRRPRRRVRGALERRDRPGLGRHRRRPARSRTRPRCATTPSISMSATFGTTNRAATAVSGPGALRRADRRQEQVRQHRHRVRRARLARRGHRGRQQALRRQHERCRSGGEDRLVSGLPVRRRLHGARAVRGHDLRRQAEERRRDQHVDRRPSGAQRRQQRTLRALRPA